MPTPEKEASRAVPKLRTTIEPEKELDVSDAEERDLRALGVVLDTHASTPEGARRAAERKTQEG
jgi:hypothetical protein